MSEYLSSEAIVLRSKDYKEDDKIISIYTLKKGKMRALVKGVKKNTSKLRSAVQTFCVTDLTFALSKGIPVVINGENSRVFDRLKDDYLRMSYASMLCEFVDKIMPENETDEEVYKILKASLAAISEGNPWSGANGGILRLLSHLGYGAEYKTCAFCGKNLKMTEVYYSSDGLACFDCAKMEGSCRKLSTEAAVIIQALQEMALEKTGYIYASGRGKDEVDKYIDLQLDNVLEYPLKSRNFLQKLAADA